MKIYTIKDVARSAGVSVTTVSRVLNARPDVSPATRERVLKVVEACNFVRNANAISLKQADAELAAIIVRGHSSPFLNGITEAILQYSSSLNVSFLVEYIDEKSDEFQTAARLFSEKRASGFIFIGSSIDERSTAIAQLDVPTVFATIDASRSALSNASSVTIDDRLMAKRVIDHLLEKGHREIAVFGGCRDGMDGLSLRYRGVLDSFRQHELTFDETRFVETRFSIHGAYDCAKLFFEAHPEVTAAFCMSDLVAFGAIRALRDLGRTVPEDVSIVGFDGIEMGRYSIPSLTTVRQPIEAIARASVDVLLSSLHDSSGRQLVKLRAEFVERESVAPPKENSARVTA